jgi:multidrug efflux pump subunit AcrA (membrane-fusion protein)
MTNHLTIIRSILLLGLTVSVSLGCSRQMAKEEPPPRAPVEAKGPLAIILGEATELLGTSQPVPDRVAKIATAVDGRVESVLRDASAKALAEGQEVKAGTIVVQLDTRIIA